MTYSKLYFFFQKCYETDKIIKTRCLSSESAARITTKRSKSRKSRNLLTASKANISAKLVPINSKFLLDHQL